MIGNDCFWRRRLWLLLLAGLVGCEKSAPVQKPPRRTRPRALVPVSGTVTVNGKPVETVVVTFLPPDGPAWHRRDRQERQI